MQRSHFSLTLATATLATLGIVIPAQGDLIENFESIAHDTNISTVTNWDGNTAGSAAEVRQTSNNAALGAAGYADSKGLEFRFQHDARRVLTAPEAITGGAAAAAVFEAKVRITDVQANGSAAAANHSSVLVIGENIGWDASTAGAEVLDMSNAVGFTVMFYNFEGSTAIRVSDGTTGFNFTTNVEGEQVAVADSAWAFNTWYTVRLSDFSLEGTGDGTNATATLNVFNSATSAALIEGLTITSNKGSETTTAGAFDTLDSLAFANVRGNGISTVDDISLIPEPGSLALLGLGGLLVLFRRR